jgi:uncharacterized protein YjbI with pentapeptide repeats
MSWTNCLPTIWKIGKVLTGGSTVFGNNPITYAILLAAIIGPAFIIWRMYSARKQSYSPEQDSITDRIAKAIDDLGASKSIAKGTKATSKPSLKIRLSAIYSLERVSQESLRDHIQVMEILCTYVRDNSKASTAILLPEGTKSCPEMWRESIPPLEVDIQAIIDVIARRDDTQILNEITEKYKLDLHGCNLQRVNFRNGKFDLALMNESHLDIAQMNRVELNGAELNRAKLNGAELDGVRLNGAELNGAKLNAANLDRAELNGAKFNGAELNRAVLSRAKLNGAVLVGAELYRANLNGAELNRAVVNGAVLDRAGLNGAVLNQAVLNRTRFNGAELNGAVLNQAALNRAELVGAELNGAQLNGANFEGANTKLAAVKSTDLSVANNLSEEQVNSMFGDISTSLPIYIKQPKSWPKDDLDYSEFYMRWQAAKKDAGLP